MENAAYDCFNTGNLFSNYRGEHDFKIQVLSDPETALKNNGTKNSLRTKLSKNRRWLHMIY
jgi:hypothetical protein